MDFPELVTELRPYQRRAAYWMVQREVGSGAIDNLDESSNASTSGMKTTRGVEHPLWVPVDSLTGQSKFFYNPYRYLKAQTLMVCSVIQKANSCRFEYVSRKNVVYSKRTLSTNILDY